MDRKGEKEEMGCWRGKREDGGESRDGDEGEMSGWRKQERGRNRGMEESSRKGRMERKGVEKGWRGEAGWKRV